MEKEVLRLNTMNIHTLWTLLIGGVVADPGSLGEFCPHGVAALHYKNLEPIHYVASCYSKETYLNTYAHFIQPMNNMKMWPTSNNPIGKQPKIRKLPGRPGKVRRKEADESRKTRKLSKRGVVITCSKCGTQGHNKRGCPTRNQADPSQT